jgi:putative chitinase
MTRPDSATLLTLEEFQKCTESTLALAEKYYPFLMGTCKAYSITTKVRLSAFLAQVSHESGGLKAIKENLNYSAQGLMKTWPKRFPSLESALPYHRNPKKIADKVYANRMGNGSVESQDGSKYIGRGLKQLTGKHNYILISKDFGVDFVSSPELLEEPLWASLSAGWFWDENNLNKISDSLDFVLLTKRINGGTIGLEDRLRRYKKNLEILKDYQEP